MTWNPFLRPELSQGHQKGSVSSLRDHLEDVPTTRAKLSMEGEQAGESRAGSKDSEDTGVFP